MARSRNLKVTITAAHKRGPRWCIAQDMHLYVEELEEALPVNKTTANWLSDLFKKGKVTRRPARLDNWSATSRLGRPPTYEYNVVSVRKACKEQLARNKAFKR
jgi:hypothetical protein